MTNGPWARPKEPRTLSYNAVVVIVSICNALLAILTFGGIGYAVFFLGASGWWFLAAYVFYYAAVQGVRGAE